MALSLFTPLKIVTLIVLAFGALHMAYRYADSTMFLDLIVCLIFLGCFAFIVVKAPLDADNAPTSEQVNDTNHSN